MVRIMRMSKLLSILAVFLRLTSYICVYMMSYIIAIFPNSSESDSSAILWFLGSMISGCAASTTAQIAFEERKDGN